MTSSSISPGWQVATGLIDGGQAVDNPRYFNRMWRSARPVGPDVMEVRSYPDMRVRVGCWIFGLLAILIAGCSGMYFGRTAYPFADQVEAVRVLTDYHAVLTEEYAAAPRRETLQEWLAGYDEVWPMHRDHAIRTLIGSFMIGVPLWLCAMFWPRRAPLRIDRRHWVAYTLLKGELAIARIGTGPNVAVPLATRTAPAPPLTFTHLPYDGFGPLLSGLIGVGSGKRRLFWMGAQPVTNPAQNRDLKDLVDLFTDDRIDQGRWLHLLRRRHFLPGDILRALNCVNLRRRPDLDDPALQALLEQAIPSAILVGDPIQTGEDVI